MKQGNREKLSVTVEPELFQVVERQARRIGVSKSKIVGDAIRLWERGRLAALAREGYEKTAAEDLEDAQAYLAALAKIEEG